MPTDRRRSTGRRKDVSGAAPIRALIVDDEPLARENLRMRLRGEADFAIAGECANGAEAIAAIEAQRPEVVFLDIRMPDRNGFEVIDEISPECQPVIIFVTAYDRYAIEAFRVHALDYLLKPFDDERFAETLQTCRRRVAELRRAGSEPVHYQLAGPVSGDLSDAAPPAAARAGERCLARLVIKARGRIFFIKATTIDWIEAQGDYACLHVGAQSYLLRRTMNELEARLDPDCFARISRSTIVNLDRIAELRPASRGEHRVLLATGHELKLTRTYRGRLEGRLGDRL
jgi:two-component system LytT family response regulator